MLTWLLGMDGDLVITIVRIALGVVFFAHGAQKALGWFGGAGLQSTVRTFREHLQIPAPLAVLSVAAEFLGGCRPHRWTSEPYRSSGHRRDHDCGANCRSLEVRILYELVWR